MSEAPEAKEKPFKAVSEHKEGRGLGGGGAAEASHGHRGVL